VVQFITELSEQPLMTYLKLLQHSICNR